MVSAEADKQKARQERLGKGGCSYPDISMRLLKVKDEEESLESSKRSKQNLNVAHCEQAANSRDDIFRMILKKKASRWLAVC